MNAPELIDRTGTLEESRKLGLQDSEYALICEKLNRNPTFTELAMFSGMWSEHCSYKNSILVLKTLYCESNLLLAKPGEENAGALRIDDKLALVFKIESHNHPSAIEPYQGAATGVGGIMRDIFTMGARPLVSLNSLRFGPPNTERNKYLLKRVVKGIGDYGNSLGIPCAGGELFFHESYSKNPLVNAMTIGIAEIEKMASAKIPGAGNLVVYAGAKTGRDGIHGASFASKELSKESREERSAVQVGDPFMEKLVMEATLECISKKLVLAIQDMGAAGLVSSSSEMSASGNVGMNLYLEKVPAREEHMQPFEFMLSESQERMLLVVAPDKWEEISAVFRKWELDAEIIGETTSTENLRIFHTGKLYADVSASLLSKSAPRYTRETTTLVIKKGDTEISIFKESLSSNTPEKIKDTFMKLVTSPNLCSRKPVYRQYDSDIGLCRIIGPGQNAGVYRIPGSQKGITATVDGNGYFIAVDPYQGGMHTVAEAYRNIISTGARPAGLTNCLNYANPYKPENYSMFKESVTGMSHACAFLKIPIISGNVSFYNESDDGPVLPTPTMGLVGILENVNKAVPAFSGIANSIYLLGFFVPSLNASQASYILGKEPLGPLPMLSLENEQKTGNCILALTEQNLLHGCIDLSGGGLIMALLRFMFSEYNANLGTPGFTFSEIFLSAKNYSQSPDLLLLGETAHSYLVSVCPEKVVEFEKYTASQNIPCLLVGKTNNSATLIMNQLHISMQSLHQAWSDSLKPVMEHV